MLKNMQKFLESLYVFLGLALLDLLTKADEKAPQVEERVLCQHPIQGAKRAYVKPRVIESLLKVYWKNGKVYDCSPWRPLETAQIFEFFEI